MEVIVEERKNSDESYSHTGTKDFIQPEREVISIPVSKVSAPRPRTQKSQNNSYT